MRLPPRVLTVTIKRNAGVVKRGGGKAARGPISIEDPQLQNPEARFQALEGGAKWGHDMFVRAEGKKAANPRAPHPLGTKLFVTNLHYEVSEADIKIELIPQRVADGDGSSGRLLKSGIRITGERGSSLGRQVIHVPQTVTANVRGRGTIKSRVVAAGDTMQE
ncbi:hypothetical protein QBZ16_004896 [Prototheca wickerhamii]|uniref:Uncharacterized protein n=1 Tax=Prototheca wickerhamii TaxID=3111 RepID=A0AAD9IJL4_PROWI|nr:hypothetical protein QBZ16_004896 [Prototheca wickerhamii]